MSDGVLSGNIVDRPFFRHTPLNRRGDSIRLVKILHDLSADGHIQCSIHHAKLSPGAADGAVGVASASQPEDTLIYREPVPYICLSYTWGSPLDQGTILVDGRIFSVRKNLESFLQIARSRLTYGLFWIDALCIDQANEAERDHQVQRMGNIFAKAKMLVTWLGWEPALERPMHLLGLDEEQTQWKICQNFYQRESRRTSLQTYVSLDSRCSTALESTQGLQSTEKSMFYVALTSHTYWRRAWVTQEIMLAKTIYVIAGNAILDYPSLVKATRSCAHNDPESHFEQFARLMLVQKDYFDKKHQATGRIMISDSWMNNWGLINLMQHFGDKSCTVRRDMVYSVLSLSRESETIKVNYQSPAIEVVRQVLKVCKDSVCLCAAAVLIRALGRGSFANMETSTGVSTPFVDLPILGIRFEEIGSTAKCTLCKSSLQLASSSDADLFFCLLTTCKDSEGHMYTEVDANGRKFLKLQTSGGVLRGALGEIGVDIEIIEEEHDSSFLLRFSALSLLNIVGGPQWGRTLRQQSCGNFWPNKSKPSKERLALSAA